jgi:hypothetical protein
VDHPTWNGIEMDVNEVHKHVGDVHENGDGNENGNKNGNAIEIILMKFIRVLNQMWMFQHIEKYAILWDGIG